MKIEVNNPDTAAEPQALLDAEPGLYADRDNNAVLHLVLPVSALNVSQNRVIVTFTQGSAGVAAIASQLNYMGRPAELGTEVKVTA